METREPTLDDIDELRQLIDAQESALDSKHKPASASWPIELIRGHNDAPRNRVWIEGGRIVAWASVQPDEHRHRVEIELFRVPGFSAFADVWEWCRVLGDEEFHDWTLWPTANYRDEEMADLFTSTGFELLRRYHLLTRPLSGEDYPVLPASTSIDDGVDPEGRFLLRVDGQVAGFVSCTNDNAHENGGFVDVLGVCHDFQGRGLGELLLRWAFAYCASRSFSDVDLAVDTGNSSGALGLYSKVGFSTLSEYHLYARPTD